MNRHYPFIVFMLLVLSSVWAGVSGCQTTQRQMSAELTQALKQTLSEHHADWLSVDTVRSFRNHIHSEDLRQKACLAFNLTDNRRPRHLKALSQKSAGGSRIGSALFPGIVMSDSLRVNDCVEACAYVTCTAFSMWSMADQRLSLFLCILSMMWYVLMMRGRKRFSEALPVVLGDGCRVTADGTAGDLTLGNLTYNAREKRFYGQQGDAVHMTPMQQQLVEMFMLAPGHELSKQEICDALWPKKDNASETLYTLVRRLKPVLEKHGRLHIESERSRSYRLIVSP